MKNIVLGICTLMLVSGTVLASGGDKKAKKQTTGTVCKKADCKDKASCPKKSCDKKPGCPKSCN